jgi:hypothetical protein
MRAIHKNSNYRVELRKKHVARLANGPLDITLLDSSGLPLNKKLRLEIGVPKRGEASFSLGDNAMCWEDANRLDVVVKREDVDKVQNGGETQIKLDSVGWLALRVDR